MTRIMLFGSVAVVAAVLLATSCGTDAPARSGDRAAAREEKATSGAGGESPAAASPARPFNAYGSVLLVDPDGYDLDMITRLCSSAGQYGDIEFGSPVIIRDADRRPVARGSLGTGEVKVEPELACAFAFAITNVPPNRGPYTLELRGHGSVCFTEANATRITLSLGAPGAST